MINLKKIKEPVYNVYTFENGDIVISKKSIKYFRTETGPKLIASNLSWDEECWVERRQLGY